MGLRSSILGLICFSLLFLPLPLGAEETLTPADRNALREMEQEVSELKESVFEAKTRLRQLEEAVLRGKIVGSKAFIQFENLAEGFFSFTSAEFYLDGEMIHRVVGLNRKDPLEKAQVFDKDLPAGEHTLQAKIRYSGSDKSVYSPFPYFKDHKFDLEHVEKFNVEYGKTTVVQLTALDKGYFKGDLKERLHLKVRVVQDWGTEPPE